MKPTEDPSEDINKRTPNVMHKEQDTTAARIHQDRVHEKEGRPEGDDFKFASRDKYLAMEQPGLSYTGTPNAPENSDFLERNQHDNDSLKYKTNGPNSRNADAFGQDDYLLRDNIDLDEDQPNSISADDAPDRNTTDEIL